jgi:hypothetical protein
MKARIELQNNVVLTGELSIMCPYTITIRVNNINVETMRQLYAMKLSVTKLSNFWSLCIDRDAIVDVNIWED